MAPAPGNASPADAAPSGEQAPTPTAESTSRSRADDMPTQNPVPGKPAKSPAKRLAVAVPDVAPDSDITPADEAPVSPDVQVPSGGLPLDDSLPGSLIPPPAVHGDDQDDDASDDDQWCVVPLTPLAADAVCFDIDDDDSDDHDEDEDEEDDHDEDQDEDDEHDSSWDDDPWAGGDDPWGWDDEPGDWDDEPWKETPWEGDGGGVVAGPGAPPAPALLPGRAVALDRAPTPAQVTRLGQTNAGGSVTSAELPVTGSPLSALAGFGLTLLVGGFVIRLTGRRRGPAAS
ncbi:hypothetical protein [Pilimelia columellifera]|uniref:hypothetical protein n=1 Tax=Pilimelia columellifera TaxID=706574 RepID=UPI0031DAE99B